MKILKDARIRGPHIYSGVFESCRNFTATMVFIKSHRCLYKTGTLWEYGPKKKSNSSYFVKSCLSARVEATAKNPMPTNKESDN